MTRKPPSTRISDAHASAEALTAAAVSAEKRGDHERAEDLHAKADAMLARVERLHTHAVRLPDPLYVRAEEILPRLNAHAGYARASRWTVVDLVALLVADGLTDLERVLRIGAPRRGYEDRAVTGNPVHALRALYGASVRIEEERSTSTGSRWRCWVDTDAGPVPVAYGATEEECAAAAVKLLAQASPPPPPRNTA
jgi:hypothetical protein